MSRLQPRSKSLATSNISSLSASATKEGLSNPETPAVRNVNRQADPLSERATLFLIRRTLCPQVSDKGRSTPTPINEILPPLSSSNEVDLQLYAFIAIIIREFVQTWYAKITPDQDFVNEVVNIIAHCTRALEQRLRNVDLESLLFDELPDLLDAHARAHRAAHNPLHPPPFQYEQRQIYHSLCPLAALSPIPDGPTSIQQQTENEAAYRQLLVQGVLAVLLPTEDLENDCLTALVGQIFSEMILGGGIGGKASEPWLLWEGITKISEVIQTRLPKSKAQVRLERSNSDLADKGPLDIDGTGSTRLRIGGSIQKTFWLILQYGFLAFTAVRFFITILATASALPSRNTKIASSAPPPKDHMETLGMTNMDKTLKELNRPLKRPIIQMRLWSCLSTLLDLDARMPWLSGAFSMVQWAAITGPGEVGNLDGMIDKILSHAIRTHVLDPTLLPNLLRTLRAALFPNNTLAPPRVIPSPSEQLLIRRRCAQTVLSLIPVRIQETYFGPGVERRISEVEEVLNMFGDSYCNKHLLYGVVELILVHLVPELAEKGAWELLDERLS